MERKQWLDNVRAIACIMVIIVHVTAITKYEFGKIDNLSWYITVIIDSASRMCVPLFLMISGFIFLGDKKVKASNVLRAFFALTFYSVLCMIYWSVIRGRDFFESVITIYQEPAMYHLWFMFYILAYYILFLIINIRQVNPKFGLLVVISVMTVFNVNLSDLIQLLTTYYIKNGFVINSLHLQLFMYCFAGAFIGVINESIRYKALAWFTCITSIILIVYLTIIKSYELGMLNPQYQNYNSVPVFLSSISAFYIIKNTTIFAKVQWFMNFVSQRSLAIYGVHAIILEIIRDKGFFLFHNPIMNIISTFLIVTVISIAMASAIKYFDKKNWVS
ncbi:acyltransferase [Citrobacter freundii]|uniref:acyltransferase n=1 Tax=Citrobacter freundii TaxID=546 RepID=UPI0019077221|nr:acyltransferase family protein [Citrobacter freundii]MBJ9289561.1 acyltransferase family protein [Citrobacter freundii]MDT7311021.1 acyltransferase family protein [Citrobacter freundii]